MASVTFIDETTAVLSGGQTISNAHLAGACLGDVCPLHKPSEHELLELPLYFNGSHFYRISGTDLLVDPDDYGFHKYGSAILRNAAFCKRCETLIESKSRHDFVSCKCGAIMTDGGYDYIRRGGVPDDFIAFDVIVTKE